MAAAGRRAARARRARRARSAAGAGGAAAPLPARGVRLAGVAVGARARRDPRRRHGAWQDAAGAGPDLPRTRARRGYRPVPGRCPDQRRVQLGCGGGALRSRLRVDTVTDTLARSGRAIDEVAAPTSWSRRTRCFGWKPMPTAPWPGLACSSTRRSSSRTTRARPTAAFASWRRRSSWRSPVPDGEQPDGAVVAAVDHRARTVSRSEAVRRAVRAAD